MHVYIYRFSFLPLISAIVRAAIAAGLMHNLIVVKNPSLVFTETVCRAVSSHSEEAGRAEFYSVDDGSLN
jgi:hypothetical protein